MSNDPCPFQSLYDEGNCCGVMPCSWETQAHEALVPSLRELAEAARGEQNATAIADAWYFDAAATEIERLRAALQPVR
jgi:hypothetical protein